jgi:hypothetical protein
VKFFQKVKEIRSKEGELHFQRFAIVETSEFALYLHKIYKADKDLHMHSHPQNFKSIILKGSYLEERLLVLGNGSTFSDFSKKRFLTVSRMLKYSRENYFISPVFHKIKVILKGPVYSLFFAFGPRERWSYYVNGYIWDFEYYRDFKNRVGFNDNGTPKLETEAFQNKP